MPMPSGSNPTILIPASTMLSALGDDPEKFLERLSSPEPFGEAPEGFAPEAVLQKGCRIARNIGIEEEDLSRELLLALALTAPLFERARAAGVDLSEIGFIFGATTAGTPEAAERIRENEASPLKRWRMMGIGRMAPVIARAFGIAGPVFTVSTACTAGAKAIAEGARLLARGRVKAVIAGGIDVLSPMTLAGFSALGARSPERAKPFRSDRTGLHLAEGGGFLLMTTEDKKFPCASVMLRGFGESSDAHHICAPDPTGDGAKRAILEALGGLAPSETGFALLHGTATEQNDAMEARVMAELLPGVPAASLKRAVGHQLAGAGAMNAAAACALLEKGGKLPFNFFAGEREFADGKMPEAFLRSLTGADNPCELAIPRILVSAFAFGGSNAALLFEKCQ
ncbi:MAG: beta-ketoacyl synthase N-terminal-like domain-containing protein [Sutterella seckii]